MEIQEPERRFAPTFDEFSRRALLLFALSPERVCLRSACGPWPCVPLPIHGSGRPQARFVVRYRAADSSLVMKMTDNSASVKQRDAGEL